MMRKSSAYIGLLSGVICSLFLSFFFLQVVFADTTSTDVTVNATVSSTNPGIVCGDGVVEGAEQCDNGGSNGACPASCSASCTINDCVVCGDGVVEGAEQCDNGGSNGACPASCSASCTINSCSGPNPNTAPTVTITDIFESIPESIIIWEATDSDGTVVGCTITYGSSDPPQEVGAVKSLGNDSYTVTLSTPKPDTIYYYDIRCTDDDNATRKKDGFFTTPSEPAADETPPQITDVQEVRSTASSITYWNASDNIGVESCVFQYTVNEKNPYSETLTVEEGSFLGGRTYRVVANNLIPGVTYDRRIICVDEAGNAASNIGVMALAPDKVPPPAVSNFTATPQGNNIVLSWSYGSVVDFKEYVITYSTSTKPTAQNPGQQLAVIADIGINKYTHQSVAKDVRYYYGIFVRDISLNESGYQNADAIVVSAVAICGNSIVEAGEQCDDGNTVNTDACTNACTIAVCGDGVIQGGVEECDGINLNGNSCGTRGYEIGDLSCNSNCTFNETQCISALPTCGDGVIDPGEECDDNNRVNSDACTNACTIAVCGDGVIQSGVEECDLDSLGGNTCQSFDYVGGTLSCSSQCTFNVQACTEDTGPTVDSEAICNDSVDNDLDGFVDCADSDCREDIACIDQPIDEERICNDLVDNDSDGAIDCADLDCVDQPACQTTLPACMDGFDNDGDGLIDAADPGCEDSDDTDEFNTDEPTVTAGDKVDPMQLDFLLADRTIQAALIEGRVSNLVGKQLSVAFDQRDAVDIVAAVTLVVRSNRYEMSLETDGKYYADIITPEVGDHGAAVEVRYRNGERDVINFTIVSRPYGRIIGNSGTSIDGAEVTLLQVIDGVESAWTAGPYRQVNPILVNEDGAYGYVVPNGRYKIIVEKNGFRDRRSFVFAVRDNVVNINIELLPLPENIGETISFVANIIEERASDTVQKVVEISNDPLVEEVTERAVVPAAAGASIVLVVPSLWSILFPLLRFLFLQPLLLIGRRKRESWGKVYHSLSKLPVDLAVVRLIDAKTDKIIQSRVTDKSGRYLFMVEPGSYKIEVTKQGFVFPSANLAGVKEDGQFLDVYHGEVLVATDEVTTLTPNIPVDPIKDGHRTVKRIVWEKWIRRTQHAVSLLGVVVTLISLYITPTMLVAGFLVLHIVIYGLFLRHVKPKKPKGWGIVYDESTSAPVGKVIARLFTKQYNKLVATQLTDSKGRYSFLVGPNEYYVAFEKEGYEQAKSKDIDYSDKSEDIITESVGIKRKTSGGP